MTKHPRLVYLLRKSSQTEGEPVLKRSDFPLRFHFGGEHFNIEVTKKGNISISKTRLTGTDGK